MMTIFHFKAFLESLKTSAIGMLGIFIITLVIIGVIVLMNYISRKLNSKKQ